MNASAAMQQSDARPRVLVALGVEFTRSHGLEYAKGLLEMLGADEETVLQLVQRIVAERCTTCR